MLGGGENRCSQSGFVKVCKVIECSSQALERTLKVAGVNLFPKRESHCCRHPAMQAQDSQG